jgi:ribokinase
MPNLYDLFVVGSVNADLVVAVPSRPRPGETVLGGDLQTLAGGKGANQAVAAARLGSRVGLLARVGDDAHGTFLRGAVKRAGVDDRTLLVTRDAPTGVALITVTRDGENSIVVAPGANRRLGPEDVEHAEAELAAAAVLVVQLEIPQRTCTRVAEIARDRGRRLILNAAPARDLDPAVLTTADPLVVNEHEAAYYLRGAAAPVDAAGRLVALGPASVVVTLGSAGAVYATAGQAPVGVPAPSVEVLDTTGAGDVFVGALAAELADSGSLDRAVRVAVAAAALAVQAEGAQPPLPPRSSLCLSSGGWAGVAAVGRSSGG